MPKIKRLNSWEVAAAVLLIEGEMHIDRLTDRVVECGISTLGLRGDTPRQSLCPQLIKRPQLFIRGRYLGYYDVRKTAPEFSEPRFMEAQRRYLDWKQQRRKQDAEERARNERLRTILDRIPRA